MDMIDLDPVCTIADSAIIMNRKFGIEYCNLPCLILLSHASDRSFLARGLISRDAGCNYFKARHSSFGCLISAPTHSWTSLLWQLRKLGPKPLCCTAKKHHEEFFWSRQ